MATPRLPSAEAAVARLGDQLEAWLDGSGARVRVRLRGPTGAGKSHVLSAVARRLQQRDVTVLHVAPPDIALDAPTHVLVQSAGSLRARGADGLLNPIFSAATTLPGKRDALLECLATVERAVILMDLPARWPGSDAGHASADQSVQSIGIQEEARKAAMALLHEAEERGHAFLLAARGSWDWPEALQDPEDVGVVPGSEGRDWLNDENNWRSLAHDAKRLAELLGSSATNRSPLALRIAVALLALGASESEVRARCEGGFSRLAPLLEREMRRTRSLRRTLSLLALARFPVSADRVSRLLDNEAPHDSNVRAVVVGALVLEFDQTWLLHPALEELVRRVADQGSKSARREDLEEQHGAHRSLIATWTADDGTVPKGDDRHSAVARMEAIHHAAYGLERDMVLREAVDVFQLCELGRALSLSEDYEGAVEVFEQVLRMDRFNSYAKEYLAYNLERLRRSAKRVVQLFKEARDAESSNPWWNRRYVECLTRRGRFEDARNAWTRALREIQLDEERPASEGLARNLHLGVAESFLRHGQLDDARSVLESVERDVLESNVELQAVWNRLRHEEEAEKLGERLFPEDVPFESRWDGPHLDVSNPQSALDRWYPGRVVSVGKRITLVLGEPPQTPYATPEVFHSDRDRDVFSEEAGVKPGRVSAGQLLELHTFVDAKARIVLYPTRRGSKPAKTAAGKIPRPSTSEAPRVSTDALQRWLEMAGTVRFGAADVSSDKGKHLAAVNSDES